MLTKKFRLLFLSCFALLLASCSDELPSRGGNVASDSYAGGLKEITLPDGMDDFHYSDFTLVLSSATGEQVKRIGKHTRTGGVSKLVLNEGLKAGEYRMLYLSADTIPDEASDDYGLGCRISIDSSETGVKVLDTYDSDMRLYGKGSLTDPYVISSACHLTRLRDVANDQISNEMLTDSTYFRQFADIDLTMPSIHAHKLNGWLPIGSQNTCPFRGIYDGNKHKISGLWISREESCGAGLFGHAEAATLRNIVMEDASIEGNFAAGSILGAAVTSGNRQALTTILNCTTTGGSVTARKGSVAIGGLVGLVDKDAKILIDSCANNGTEVKGSYGVGGIVGTGALFSRTVIRGCKNLATVSSDFTGCGGIAGTCDSLYVMSCENHGKITGSASFTSSDKENEGLGTGGIAGGSGRSYFYTCHNYGDVTGYKGVAGIIGSTCASAKQGYFNNVMMKSCGNEGAITGQTSVGGICGEAQFGCYSVYNTGTITALSSDAIAGGIVGNTSVSVVQNAVNSGKVEIANAECVGGIVGKTTWGTLMLCQNNGDINTTAKYVGGIVALAGSQTVINYCGNSGNIVSNGKGYVGGIVGEVGDPRKWSVMNTINCVIGGVECVLGVVGSTIALTTPQFLRERQILQFVLRIENWSKIHKVAHGIEMAADILALAYDWSMKFYELAEYVGHKSKEMMQAEISQQASEIDEQNTAKVKALRRSAIDKVVLFSGLDAAAISEYINNVEKVAETFESSDENIEAFVFNLNNERETRAKEVQKFKKVEAIIHTVVGCAALVVSTGAFVASSLLLPGSSLAVGLAVTAGVSTVVGGVNAIAENCDDYQANVVSVTQCVNMGKISADAADAVGGIAGHLQQFSFVGDCLNTGQYAGAKACGGGIAGRSDSKSEHWCCLSVGDKWADPFCKYSHMTTYTDVYYLHEAYTSVTASGATNYLKFHMLCRDMYYSWRWDLNKDKSTWGLTNKEGYFPVPKNSKMETSCYKN